MKKETLQLIDSTEIPRTIRCYEQLYSNKWKNLEEMQKKFFVTNKLLKLNQ